MRGHSNAPTRAAPQIQALSKTHSISEALLLEDKHTQNLNYRAPQPKREAAVPFTLLTVITGFAHPLCLLAVTAVLLTDPLISAEAHTHQRKRTVRRKMAAVDPTVADTNSSSAGSTLAWATLPPKQRAANRSDTCACHADGTKRTCYECLNVLLQSGDECVINPLGECVSATMVAKEQTLLSLPSYSSIAPHDDAFYSSRNFTYCSVTDQACSEAWLEWSQAYSSNSLGTNTSFYRTGTAGCICTVYCDFRQYDLYNIVIGSQYTLGDTTCKPTSTSPTTQNGNDNTTFARMNLAKNIAMLVCMFTLAVLIIRQGVMRFQLYRYEQRMRERREAQRQQRNQATQGHFGPRMALEGWNAYREQLIDDEQRKLGRLILTEAPEHTEPEVEIGDGFRPASPKRDGLAAQFQTDALRPARTSPPCTQERNNVRSRRTHARMRVVKTTLPCVAKTTLSKMPGSTRIVLTDGQRKEIADKAHEVGEIWTMEQLHAIDEALKKERDRGPIDASECYELTALESMQWFQEVWSKLDDSVFVNAWKPAELGASSVLLLVPHTPLQLENQQRSRKRTRLPPPRATAMRTVHLAATTTESTPSSSVGASSSGDASASEELTSSRSTTSCSCNATETKATPRSCYQCMNIPVASGEQVRSTSEFLWIFGLGSTESCICTVLLQCVVSSTGDCINEAEAANQRQAAGDSEPYEFYSSVNFTYCVPTDSVCAECRNVWTQQVAVNASALTTTASRVCFGHSGCLCLAVCEVAALHTSNLTCTASEVIISTVAPAATPSSDSDGGANPDGYDFSRYVWVFVFVALFVLVSVMSYQQTASEENTTVRAVYRRLFRGRKKREAPNGPTLSLSGWRAYQERLIHEEQERTRRGKAAAPRLVDTAPVNVPLRDGLALLPDQAPPRITVEVGEGFRPASPSHLNRQQQIIATSFVALSN
ncbi:hypothetical protein FI667_g11512, partial [Globisporangium splendens]